MPPASCWRSVHALENKIFDAMAKGGKPDPEEAAVASVLARLINDKTPTK
jgi:hypothetical protein